MSGFTQTTNELYYSVAKASTNLATFTAEDNLIKTYPSCRIPGSYFETLGKRSSSLKIKALGLGGSTTTPTYTFTLRLIPITSSDPAWSAGGVILGASGAVPAASTVLLAPWTLDVDVVLQSIPAAGSATLTVVTLGSVAGALFPANGGFPANNVSPVLATIDPSQTYSLFLSCACSASNALNLINCQILKVYGEN
jgi:hypothetical protein